MILLKHIIAMGIPIVQFLVAASEASNFTTGTDSIVHCQAGSPCHVHCNSLESCKESTIFCPHDTLCNVHCNGPRSCSNATINSGNQSTITVHCIGEESCRNTMIDAVDADELVMTGCSASDSCIGVTMFCPENVNGLARCTVICMFSYYTNMFIC